MIEHQLIYWKRVISNHTEYSRIFCVRVIDSYREEFSVQITRKQYAYIPYYAHI